MISRTTLKALTPIVAMLGALTVSGAASATDTTFAQYTGGAQTFKVTTASGLVSFSETGSTTFSFVDSSLATLFPTGVKANIAFTASAPSSAYTNFMGFDFQSKIAGTYKFTSTAAYTIFGIFHPIGSDLLSVAFSGGILSGQDKGKTATLVADNGVTGETVTYSSDFLSFIAVNQSDFSVALSSISPKFTGTTTLAPFTGSPVGTFASDPAPSVIGETPEPATWAMMLVGFAAIGMGIRGNARRTLRAA